MKTSGMAEWLRSKVSSLVGFNGAGSNPFVGTTDHKPTANSDVHHVEVG